MELNGYVSGGVVVFEGRVELLEGTKVRVVPVLDEQPRTLAERFQNVIAKATGLSEDMAAQHDQYIHASPQNSRPRRATPESMLQLAGAVPAADCAEMEAAINEGCGVTGGGR
jgi:hypothetical protein